MIAARRMLLVLIVLAAAFVRVHGIDHDSTWGDENLSVFIAKMPVSEIFTSVRWYEQIPPLHHLILHYWMMVFGDRETAIRMPSALAGVASVLLMYRLVRRLLGRREAIAAATVLAFAPLHVEYGQEARAYELAFMLAVASTDLFVTLTRRRSSRETGKLEAGYAVVIALMLYAHIYGIFIVAAHQLAYLIRFVTRRDRTTPPLQQWVALTAATALLYSPWAPTVWRWVRAVQVNFWVKEVTWHDVSRAYWVYAGSTPLYVLAIALTVLGVARVRRRRPAVLPLLLLVMLLPVIVPVWVSIMTRPNFAPRYGMFACIGFYPLIAAGVAALRGRALRGAAMVAIVALSVAAINGEAVNVPKSPWRQGMAWLNRQMRPTDKAVVHIKAMTRTYDYYMPRDKSHRRGFDIGSIPIDPKSLNEPDDRVWFVLYGHWAQPRDMLRRGPWFIRSHKFFDDLLIMELDNTIPPGAEPWATNEPVATQPTSTPTTAEVNPASPPPSPATRPTTSSRSE